MWEGGREGGEGRIVYGMTNISCFIVVIKIGHSTSFACFQCLPFFSVQLASPYHCVVLDCCHSCLVDS